MYIFILMCQVYICLEKQQFSLLVTFSLIFVADTKIIFGYIFEAHLKNLFKVFAFQLYTQKNEKKLYFMCLLLKNQKRLLMLLPFTFYLYL